MTQVISFISQKGGVGKSTLARALAVECTKAGLSVQLTDLDSQQNTIIDWNQVRLQNQITPTFPVSSFTQAKQAILSVSSQTDLLIIDGPARSSTGTLFLAQESTLLIQPTGASRDDMVPALREFNSLVKLGIPKAKLVFALNHISSQSEGENARSFIQENGYSVLASYLPEKPSFRQAQNEGKAVTEVPFKSLQSKVDQLLQSLLDLIYQKE